MIEVVQNSGITYFCNVPELFVIVPALTPPKLIEVVQNSGITYFPHARELFVIVPAPTPPKTVTVEFLRCDCHRPTQVPDY